MKLHPVLFLFLASAALADGPPPLGRWVTESGNLEVDIAPCAAEPPAGALCGKVVRVLANRSMSAPGEPIQPADTRPALGMTLLSGLLPAGDGVYKGTIYNRENAKHYSVKLTPAEPAQLLVRGYVGLPLFGKTQVWRRPAPEAAAEPASGAAR
ncbi:DUF2147 domain-containing protein [Rhizobacter sp. J219]|uniref:DUF2147 domain-containing protein n=1 Tax=Rhizobacter sp. J219 TaxID=2898430 RepID=UPI002150D6D0|nr:DUF2147 domain-containing protein [Rhizobacter sp. J219]MCR5883804.1 DUF2147 domain-containing protein [Rhizobacter sp. J219]